MTNPSLSSGSAVPGAVTDTLGGYTISTIMFDHTLVFSKTPYLDITVDVVWDATDARFEVAGSPLSSYPNVVMQLDESATLAGQLASPVAGMPWPSSATITSSRKRCFAKSRSTSARRVRIRADGRQLEHRASGGVHRDRALRLESASDRRRAGVGNLSTR